jgi:murein lipoprotein
MPHFNKKILLIFLLGFVFISGGCATRGDVEGVTQETQTARQIAESAQQTANEALEAANEAKALAADADERSRRTEESINRMFQRSMYK